MNVTSFDKPEFRKALGQFATGVTVITTLDEVGARVGVTANSFSSLSMEPPLILWSLRNSAYSLPAFAQAKFFNVHILGFGQHELSKCFARRGIDKFANIETTKGLDGTPILPDHAALFECKTAHRYAGGDHVIIVGQVMKFSRKDMAPLVIHDGQYATI